MNLYVTTNAPEHGESEPVKETLVGQSLLHCEVKSLLPSRMTKPPKTHPT